MDKIVIATGNKGKLAEFQNIFTHSGIEVISQAEFNIGPVEETGLSFIENALIKARWAAQHCPYPCLADDSGLCIPDLDNRPGIYSARYAGEHTSFEEKMSILIKEVAANNLQHPPAFFYCALALVKNANDPCPIVTTGRWDGIMQDKICGEHGFGYDPIFYLPEFQKTAAELEPQQKAELCHRATAMKKLFARITS